METSIPLFPCQSLDETLTFYQALGFEITYRQDQPYIYGAVRLGQFNFHLSRLTMYGKSAFGSCLVFVPQVATYHEAFASGLREAFGRIPTAGLPRITRLRPGHTRFKTFDPSGNMITFINHDEPDANYGWSEENLSELRQALEMAEFVRDVYANDKSAAKTLDKALAKGAAGSAADRDRVLAARAELAVAYEKIVADQENGQSSAGGNTAWISQTVQAGYSGAAYLRALPDVGELLSAAEAESGPQVNFPVAIETTGTYAVWVRARAADSAGDSVHVGLDGQVAATADNLTGFAPNTWGWSRLTLDSSNATLDLNSSGSYTLGLFMREDGIRVDKLLLITDTNYIPTGLGPAESQQTVITSSAALSEVTSITYGYDPLYRLSEATYSGHISATFQYEYDALGNRLAYTKTLTTTQVTTYTYSAANQLVTAKLDSSSDTWHYVYDGNGNQVRQVPNGLTPANGETRYTFNQMNRLIQVETHNGSSYQVQAEVAYDGIGNRLQAVAYTGGTAITTTFTLDSLNNNLPLVTDNSLEATILLYGIFGLGQYQDGEWLSYLGDGQRTVRQLVNDQSEITLVRTYDPFGGLLDVEGIGSSFFGFAGALEGAGGLLYVNGRYFDPVTGRFLSPSHNFDPMHPSRGLNGYLASMLMANPLTLLLPLLVFFNRRKRRGSKVHKSDLFLLSLFLVVGLSACEETPSPPDTPPTTPPEILPVNTTPPSTSTPTVIENKLSAIESNYPFVDLDSRVNESESKFWTLKELNTLDTSLSNIVAAMGTGKAQVAFGMVPVIRDRISDCSGHRALANPGGWITICDITFYDDNLPEPAPDESTNFRGTGDKDARKTIIHEFGHIWDFNTGNSLSGGIPLDSSGIFCGGTRMELSPNSDRDDYMDFSEEWADSFALWVLDIVNNPPIEEISPFNRPEPDVDYPWDAHKNYVQDKVDNL